MESFQSFSTRLLDWYAQNARDLPWRGHPDSYVIWVSEIMLQQTRVETVIPYFERWMARFPTVGSLAAASQQDVLILWEGLGYYGRARRLFRAAQIVMDEHGGELPRDVQSLRRLPGIGRYTAAAIASLAFDMDEIALDGNIRRVFSRVFDVSIPARSGAGERRLRELAMKHLPSGKASVYNQALMDLGAMICTPRAPQCANCPLTSLCAARTLGVQEQRPVHLPKAKTPHHIVTAAVLQKNGTVLIAQRPANGLLGGLWEFPGGKMEAGEDFSTCLRREIHEELGVEVSVGEPLGVYKHAYTHFRITLHAFRCVLVFGKPVNREHSDIRWVPPAELTDYPMGKIDRMIAQNVQNNQFEV